LDSNTGVISQLVLGTVEELEESEDEEAMAREGFYWLEEGDGCTVRRCGIK
jgi:hypothetical protein